MGLADVCRGVQAKMEERGVPCQSYYGEQFIADQFGGYRVVWVPNADQFAEKLPSGPGTIGTFGLNPRTIKTRVAGATVTLQARPPELAQPSGQVAQDYAAMETFIDAFIASLADTVSVGGYALQGGQYVNDKARHVRTGLDYQLAVLVPVPVLDIPWPYAAATTECVETYVEAPARAEVTVEEQLAPPDYEAALTYTAPTEE